MTYLSSDAFKAESFGFTAPFTNLFITFFLVTTFCKELVEQNYEFEFIKIIKNIRKTLLYFFSLKLIKESTEFDFINAIALDMVNLESIVLFSIGCK